MHSAALASMRAVHFFWSRVTAKSTMPTITSAATMAQTTGEISANLENIGYNPFRILQFAGRFFFDPHDQVMQKAAYPEGYAAWKTHPVASLR